MSEQTSSRRPRTATVRWVVLGVLVAVAVIGVAIATLTVVAETEEGGPVARVQALEDPPADPTLEREQLLGEARDFVVGFNTYGPDMLAEDGTMPEYAGLADAMTSTFATVFDENVGFATQTVTDLQVRRSADVHAVGVASQDDDSAELLVAGTATFAYPDPKKEGAWVQFDPERFRYQVSLVRQRGEWLVDDLDDLDDDLPSFAQSAGEQQGGLPGQLPSEQTSPGAGGAPGDAPSGSPADGATPSEEATP